MAQTVLTIAAYAVGYYFGGPVGGAAAAALVTAATAEDVKGPRLSDTRVQISSYGGALPRTYGTIRLAGNVIWSTDLVETEEESGKGGGGVTTFAYSVSCAVAIAEGEICGIRRIWADTKLVYDARAYESAIATSPGMTPDEEAALEQSVRFARFMAFYPGTEEQLPDPTIESIEGAGNVEAYRGTSYIVFTDLPLGDYGNRVPSFSFEVITRGTEISGLAPWVVEDDGVRPAYGGTEYLVFPGGLDQGNTELAVYRGPSQSEALAALQAETHSWYAVYQGYFTSAEGLLSPFGPQAAESLNANGGADHVFLAYNYELPDIVIFDGYGQEGLSDTQWYPGLCATSLGPTPAVMKSSFPEGIVPSLPASGHFGISRSFRSEPSDPYGIATYETGDGFGANNTDCQIPETPFFEVVHGIQHKFIRVGRVSSDPDPEEDPDDWFRSCIASTVYLSDVVGDLCRKGGLTDAQLDLTALDDDVVDGYVVSRQMSAREAIDPLRMAFFFDLVESGDVIKAVKRGGGSVATLTLDDIGASLGADGAEPVQSDRQQETELPQLISASYFAQENAYQTGTQQDQRSVTVSQQQVTMQLPLSLTDQRAAEIVSALLYEAWISRNRRTTAVTNRHAHLEPTDVIDIDDGSFTYRVRIAERSEQDGVITLACVDEDAASYTQTGSVGSPTTGDDQTVRIIGETVLELLDIPIVRDTDDNPGYYAAVAGERPDTWRGARLLRSPDGSTYTALADITSPSTLGAAVGELADFAGGNTVDEMNSVDILLTNGSLASVTLDAMLNYSNLFVLGEEILQAQRCVLVGADTYRLSGLLRGRFGTEQHMGTHAAGDRFVALSTTSTTRINAPITQLNEEGSFKAVTFGELIADAEVEEFTNTGAGVKPLSPIELHAGFLSAGNYRLTWKRRSRIGQRWVDYIDTPLGEASEQYLVELYDSADTLLSSQVVTAQTVDIVADPTDYVRVYQMSASAGPGFPAEVTI